MIIMPRRNTTAFLLSADKAAWHTALMRTLLREYDENPEAISADHYCCKDILHCCERVVEDVTWSTVTALYQNEINLSATKAIAHLGDKALCEKALPLCYLEPVDTDAIDLMIQRHGSEWLQKCWAVHFSSIPDFISRLSAIAKVATTQPEHWEWAQVRLAIEAALLQLCHVKVLVDLAIKWAKEPQFTPM